MAKTQKFKSGPQVLVSLNGHAGRKTDTSLLADSTAANAYNQKIYEEMLRDPTIKLAVDVIAAMLKRQPWTVEGDDTEYCNFIYSWLEPLREQIVRSSLRGMLRYGWRCFEIVYDIDEETGHNKIVGLRALKNAYTSPLVFDDTGEFAGVEVRGPGTLGSFGAAPVEIDAQHILFVNLDEEGHGDLGEPLLRAAMGPHLKWVKCDEGAQRYDQKVAGGFIFIKYPVGSTPYASNGNVATDNARIMVDMANSFEAAGYAGVPVKVDPVTGEVVDASAWSVEHIAASGGLQPAFIVREKYLDALKLRAFGIPERAVTEGTFGTKAEAESHADIAIIVNLDRHALVIESINEGPLRELNIANLDDPTAARVVLGKLDPADRELFATIFTSLMADPVFGEKIAGSVDVDLLLDKLNVPTLSEEEREEQMLELEEDSPPPSEDDENPPPQDDEEIQLEDDEEQNFD